jgi:hypothetical protein
MLATIIDVEINLFLYYLQTLLMILFVTIFIPLLNDLGNRFIKNIEFLKTKIATMVALFATHVFMINNIDLGPLDSINPEGHAFAIFTIAWMLFGIICLFFTILGVICWAILQLPPLKRKVDKLMEELERRSNKK